jgi:hypothetical protein
VIHKPEMKNLQKMTKASIAIGVILVLQGHTDLPAIVAGMRKPGATAGRLFVDEEYPGYWGSKGCSRTVVVKGTMD